MSPSRDPILDLTRYAEVLAHTRYFPSDKHAEVIARLGIRRADWKAAAEKWQRARDAEWVRLWYKSFTILDQNHGLGASQTAGTLEPTDRQLGATEFDPRAP